MRYASLRAETAAFTATTDSPWRPMQTTVYLSQAGPALKDVTLTYALDDDARDLFQIHRALFGMPRSYGFERCRVYGSGEYDAFAASWRIPMDWPVPA